MLDIISKILLLAAIFIIVIAALILGAVLIIRKMVINSIANGIMHAREIYNDLKKK